VFQIQSNREPINNPLKRTTKSMKEGGARISIFPIIKIGWNLSLPKRGTNGMIREKKKKLSRKDIYLIIQYPSCPRGPESAREVLKDEGVTCGLRETVKMGEESGNPRAESYFSQVSQKGLNASHGEALKRSSQLSLGQKELSERNE